MNAIKPILFNTDMVRAILAGRKMVTRRVVKPQPVMGGFFETCFDWHGVKATYRPGDILYVRETWAKDGDVYRYKAGFYDQNRKWHPSIHMPREAARIFLRVTNVRVERLQNMPPYDIAFDGFRRQRDFITLWDSTLKPANRAIYGWVANPWVWVIEFERCERKVKRDES